VVLLPGLTHIAPNPVRAVEGSSPGSPSGGAPEKPQQSYEGDLGKECAETQCFVSVRPQGNPLTARNCGKNAGLRGFKPTVFPQFAAAAVGE
jgi:hypothetical protein